MYISFVIYEGMTALDFVGIYDPLTRLHSMGCLSGVQWDVCARTAQVRDHSGLVFTSTRVGAPLEGYDMVVVPGGFSSRTLIHDTAFIDWLKTAEPCPLKVSVCTGALLLGAAGFLTHKPATTHPSAYALLAPYCAQVVTDQRVVDADHVITARGVTASIDLGLYLCEKLAGRATRERIQQQMDYSGSV
ncbi:MAG: DJ-1/PfpI family protein [Chloroflexi bacterium]|nr:DJ-1/PfpI family protein [Chloroflexota bacterium]